MATKSFTVCDRCGEVKRETNHWWQVAIYRILIVSESQLAEERFALVIVSFGDPFPEQRALNVQQYGVIQTLCGERCLLAEVTNFMKGKRGAGDGQVRTVEG